MRLARRLLGSVSALLRRRPVDHEIEEELEAYLEESVAERVAQGMSPAEAHRAAKAVLGSAAVVREQVRDAGWESYADTLWQDIRYAARTLARAPGFSAVAILTLAVGIGASTALFSLIDAAVLRPVPYPEPDRIVSATIGTAREGFGDRVFNQSPSLDELRQWRRAGVFSAVAAWDSIFSCCIIQHPAAERVDAQEASDGYFGLLGNSPILGRDFTAADLVPGAPAVVVVSHAYWRTRLGGRPDAIGGTVRYDGLSATVVGILPEGFQPSVALWRPIRLESNARRGSLGEVYGRLAAGVTAEEAAQRLAAITAPRDNRSPTGDLMPGEGEVRLTSVLESTVSQYETMVLILAGAVGLIVLIACANVAGLLLARGAKRQREFAVRASLGAGRLRLIRQVLVEGLVLAAGGAVLGVGVTWLAMRPLLALLPIRLPSDVVVAMNPTVLTACVALSLNTGVLSSLIPAIRFSRADSTTVLAHRMRMPTTGRRAGQLLVAAQVALAVVLVAAAGLMIRSFTRLSAVDLGFDPDAIVAFRVAPATADPSAHQQYYASLLEAVRAIPGVAAAGAIDFFALGDSGVGTIAYGDGEATGVGVVQVLPGFFDAMGLRLQVGRFPTSGPGAATEAVAIISASASNELFPRGPLGHQVTVQRRPYEVVGVVADFSHGGPLREPQPTVFLPRNFMDSPMNLVHGMTIVVRPAGPLSGLGELLRRAAEDIGPPVVVEPVRPGGAWLGDRVAVPRNRTVLLGLLGSLGLLLTLVGIFGTTAYAVARRTWEVGVRMALGARPQQVVGGIVREAAWPVALGLTLGLAGAVGATRVIASFLFETEPTDPPTFVATTVLLAACAVLAAWLPARRAARVDPVAALRAE